MSRPAFLHFQGAPRSIVAQLISDETSGQGSVPENPRCAKILRVSLLFCKKLPAYAAHITQVAGRIQSRDRFARLPSAAFGDFLKNVFAPTDGYEHQSQEQRNPVPDHRRQTWRAAQAARKEAWRVRKASSSRIRRFLCRSPSEGVADTEAFHETGVTYAPRGSGYLSRAVSSHEQRLNAQIPECVEELPGVRTTLRNDIWVHEAQKCQRVRSLLIASSSALMGGFIK